jgi:hypothetical protein
VGAYERLAASLAALDPHLFVYPYPQTHVTVLTLVSFKEHVEPSPEEVGAVETVVPLVAEIVAPVVRGMRPFPLALGTPRLTPQAVYLPIQDETGAVARVRGAVLPALRAASPLLRDCRPPPAVHSTIARFAAAPNSDFAARFDRWAAEGRALGPVTIDAVLVTTETRPYMKEGRVVKAFPLR